MLSAKFAFLFEPVIENARTSLDEFKPLKRNVLVPLCLVVGVYLLEALVENAGKLIYIVRLATELHNPLVTTLSVGIHEDWRRSIFHHFGSRLLAGLGQSLLSIIDDEFLAKSIDERLRSTCNDELIGILLREANHVADDVTP